MQQSSEVLRFSVIVVLRFEYLKRKGKAIFLKNKNLPGFSWQKFVDS